MQFSVSSGMGGAGDARVTRLRRKSGSSSGPRGAGGRLRAPTGVRPAAGPAGEEPGDRPDEGEEQDQQHPERLGQVALPRLLGLDAVDQRRRSSGPAGARVGSSSQHRSSFSPGAYDDRTLHRGRGCAGSRPVRLAGPAHRDRGHAPRAGGAAPGRAGRRAGPPARRPASRCLPGHGARTTTAPTASPHSGSGVPTTTASLTPGTWLSRASSTCAGSHLDPAGVDDVVDAAGHDEPAVRLAGGPRSSVRNHRRPSLVTRRRPPRSGPGVRGSPRRGWRRRAGCARRPRPARGCTASGSPS